MSNPTAEAVFQEIQEKAAKTNAVVRRVAAMAVGEWARQGDVMLVRLGDGELGPTYVETEQRQLAAGSTKGSRHVLVTPGARVFSPRNPKTPLEGPTIECPGARVVIEHPEHAHLDLPSGRYGVLYQRDFAKERSDELRRVQD